MSHSLCFADFYISMITHFHGFTNYGDHFQSNQYHPYFKCEQINICIILRIIGYKFDENNAGIIGCLQA